MTASSTSIAWSRNPNGGWCSWRGAFRAGKHDQIDSVRNLRCRTITVSTRRPREVSADGEIITRTPAHFTVIPQAVRVFVP